MALRLRRALTLSSSIIKNIRYVSAITSSSRTKVHGDSRNHILNQSHSFHSSLPSFSSRPSYNNNDDDKIGADTVLFEGCDYNHWLITMDFPKDPAPTPEEMVDTYVRTLAMVVGSEEEAKKRMYACSTSTYHGFQATMTEEMSEKFRGLPGVVFILPDSYIDPINKEYGGDKYINGTIISRPPPVQYSSRSGGRYGDRNRNFDRPRNDRPMQQGNQPYDRQPSMQGDGRNQPFDRQPPMQDGRNQPFDRQPPMQGDGRNQPFNRQPPMQGDGRNQPFDRQLPMQGDGRNQPFDRTPMQADGRSQPFNRQPPMQADGHSQPYDRQGSMPGDGRNYGPPQSYPPQSNYGPPGQGERRDSMPMGGRDYAPGGYPAERREQMPPYSQGGQGNISPQERRDFTPGAQRDYAPAEHRDFRGDNRNFSPPPPTGGYGQADAPGFRQSYPGVPAEGQRFQQGQQSDFMPTGQTWNDKGQF